MRIPGTNITLGEAIRLLILICIPPYLLEFILIWRELLPPPDNLLTWIALALAAPAAWGAFLSAIADSRTLLGRPHNPKTSNIEQEVQTTADEINHKPVINHGLNSTIVVGDISESKNIAVGNHIQQIDSDHGQVFLDSKVDSLTIVNTENYIVERQSGTMNSVSTLTVNTLPSPTQIFEGRQEEMNRLISTLTASSQAQYPLIFCIRGMGGVGKTELALQVASRILQDYPDAQLFVQCQPIEIPLSPEVLLGQVILMLDPRQKLPDTIHELQAMSRRLMGGKRGILVVDNAATSEQIETLQQLPPGWVMLITSRSHFAVRDATLIDLNILSQSESIILFDRLLEQGGRRETTESSIDATISVTPLHSLLNELTELCGYLPLVYSRVSFLTDIA